eukprot:Colp12_sorted_trinity150504_noHs@31263
MENTLFNLISEAFAGEFDVTSKPRVVPLPQLRANPTSEPATATSPADQPQSDHVITTTPPEENSVETTPEESQEAVDTLPEMPAPPAVNMNNHAGLAESSSVEKGDESTGGLVRESSKSNLQRASSKSHVLQRTKTKEDVNRQSQSPLSRTPSNA